MKQKDTSKGDIYIITCVKTNKQYIGQAKHYVGKNLKPHGANGRWHRHVTKAYNCNHYSINTIWHDIKKYGSDKFKIEVIEVCDVKELDEKEAYNINKFNTLYPNGYNILTGVEKNHVLKNFQKNKD